LKYFIISLTSLGDFAGMGGGKLETEASFLVSLLLLFFRILLILEVNFNVTLFLNDVLLSMQRVFHFES